MISTNNEPTFTESRKKPFFIGVSGGTASGKTTVCKTVIDQIKEDPIINDTNVVWFRGFEILYFDFKKWLFNL